MNFTVYGSRSQFVGPYSNNGSHSCREIMISAVDSVRRKGEQHAFIFINEYNRKVELQDLIGYANSVVCEAAGYGNLELSYIMTGSQEPRRVVYIPPSMPKCIISAAFFVIKYTSDMEARFFTYEDCIRDLMKRGGVSLLNPINTLYTSFFVWILNVYGPDFFVKKGVINSQNGCADTARLLKETDEIKAMASDFITAVYEDNKNLYSSCPSGLLHTLYSNLYKSRNPTW